MYKKEKKVSVNSNKYGNLNIISMVCSRHWPYKDRNIDRKIDWKVRKQTETRVNTNRVVYILDYLIAVYL